MSTSAEIATQICADQRPSGADGASNFDRARFVCDVFECEAIDLDQHYDFSQITDYNDPEMVEACKHVALLQMAYFKELVDYEMMEPIEGDIKLNYLTLSVQRINWHLQHLEMGRRTPPFPGLN